MASNMRPRTPVDESLSPPAKRKRISGSFSGNNEESSPFFAANLMTSSNISLLAEQYHSSQPFKHVVIDKIFQESLLMKVKDEIVEHLSFTEKETDIYKASASVSTAEISFQLHSQVLQTGDLSSLSYLDETQRKLFPSLQTLRDSLYSKEFRDFIRKVTGCGTISRYLNDFIPIFRHQVHSAVDGIGRICLSTRTRKLAIC
jgi:Rps23 Pro-64 3,4-dihydroxylase Tpa1-like proline 4-hydroxylase